MILEEIAGYTKIRIEEQKQISSLEEIKEKAESIRTTAEFPFEKALKTGGLSFICEVKKASPSKGIIAQEFPYLEIAREYEEAGAAAISVLTEPKYFLGSSKHLQEISGAVSLPVLRKDFVIDSYQIYEAKVLGASAVLLISELLEEDTLREFIAVSDGLGLSCLVESHTEYELEKALKAGARIIGVNNRNLKTFEVDVSTSLRLRRLVPRDKVFVSESGIKTPQDVRLLRENDTDAVLIGELLMTCPDKKNQLNVLRGDG